MSQSHNSAEHLKGYTQGPEDLTIEMLART
jgi:hypothetical protein